jgi:hypothetical protein
MSIPGLLACLLLAAPASAAGTHTLIARFVRGGNVYSHSMKVAEGSQEVFKGQSFGQNILMNAVLAPKDGSLLLQLQLEVSRPDGSRSVQVQTGVTMNSGDRVTAVECGDWRLDLALDAALPNAAPPAWKPGGPNYRLATTVGKRRCRQVRDLESQTNIVDSVNVGGRRGGFILNTILLKPAKNASSLQYQIEDTPNQLMGSVDLALGRKASDHGGAVEFLLEGPPFAPVPSAVPAPAAPATAPPDGGGAVPLLR